MITPNHAAHYDSAALYLAADEFNTALYYMTAWQVFGMASRVDQFLMQRMGCFSIDRESTDRKAYRQAVDVLQSSASPLVVFPEGDIYHVTDRVTPFREGAAAVAITAARKSRRPVVTIPCGIKFWYLDDPIPSLHRLMTQLDERLVLRPQPGSPLVARIYRFAEALLSLKEIEFVGTSQSGELAHRIRQLADFILSNMESRLGVSKPAREIPDRVKELRRILIKHKDELERQPDTRKKSRRFGRGLIRKRLKNAGDLPAQSGESLPNTNSFAADMEDLFVVMQLYSYPGDYLAENPTVERLAETLDKFEEDVLDREIPSLHGRRRVEISFGSAIPVPGDSGRTAVSSLTQTMHAQVQLLVDQLAQCEYSEPGIVKPLSRRRRKVSAVA